MSALQKTAFVISNDQRFKDEVSQLLLKIKNSDYHIKNYNHRFFLENIRDEEPDLVIFDCGEDTETVFSLLRKIGPNNPTLCTKIICAGKFTDVQTILRLNNMGVTHFLNIPINEEEMRSVLNRIRASEMPERRTKNSGQVVTVCSPKGGTGVTLITSNLAVTLSKYQRPGYRSDRVAVCDLSYQCGSISTYLNIVPRYTIRDIVDKHELLDASFLQGIMIRHSSGVHVLAGPREDQEQLTIDHIQVIKSTLNMLRESYDLILIDAGNLSHDLLQAILSESDSILLVGNLDVASLKGLMSFFGKLKSLHYASEQIKILINRFNSKNQLDIKEFEKKIHHPMACCLPNNYALCIESINTGQPICDIHERSDIAKRISDLAEMVRKPVQRAVAKDSNGTKGQELNGGSLLDVMKKGLLKCI